MTPHQQQTLNQLPQVDPDNTNTLRQLERQGFVNSLDLGGHVMWWVTDNGKAAL